MPEKLILQIQETYGLQPVINYAIKLFIGNARESFRLEELDHGSLLVE